MYVVVVYDIEEERVERVRKVLQKYFTWVQNSVFEGEIGEGRLAECKAELRKVIKATRDSVYFYEVKHVGCLKRKVLGVDKKIDSMFL